MSFIRSGFGGIVFSVTFCLTMTIEFVSSSNTYSLVVSLHVDPVRQRFNAFNVSSSNTIIHFASLIYAHELTAPFQVELCSFLLVDVYFRGATLCNT